MRLTTIQPAIILEIIEKNGEYVCEPTKSFIYTDGEEDNYIREAYDWLVKIMRQRIPNSPENVAYPVWAWCNNPELEDDIYHAGEKGDKYVALTLEIPDDQVILSDFDEWSCAIVNAPIWTEEEWELYEGEDENPSSTWDRCLRKPGEFKTDDYIQATFWRLKKEYIVNILKYTSLGPKSYDDCED